MIASARPPVVAQRPQRVQSVGERLKDAAKREQKTQAAVNHAHSKRRPTRPNSTTTPSLSSCPSSRSQSTAGATCCAGTARRRRRRRQPRPERAGRRTAICPSRAAGPPRVRRELPRAPTAARGGDAPPRGAAPRPRRLELVPDLNMRGLIGAVGRDRASNTGRSAEDPRRRPAAPTSLTHSGSSTCRTTPRGR